MNRLELKTLVRVLDYLGKPWSDLPYGLRDLIELDAPPLARAWDQLSIEQHREALRSHVAARIEDLHLKIGFHEDDAEESSLRQELALAHGIIEKLRMPEAAGGSSQGSTVEPSAASEVEKRRPPAGQGIGATNVSASIRNQQIVDANPGTSPKPNPLQRNRGAAEPRNDEAVLKAMLKEAACLARECKTFSVQDYVLAHTKKIEGSSNNAKVRRLQRKFAEAIKRRPD